MIVLSFVLLSFWHDALDVLAAGGVGYMWASLHGPIARTDATMAASLASKFGLSGFRALTNSPAFAEQAVLDHSCTASIAAFDPFMRGGQNEVDELSIEL